MFTWLKKLLEPEYKTKDGFLRDSRPVPGSGTLKEATLRIYPNGTFVVERLYDLYEATPKPGSTTEFVIVNAPQNSDYKEFILGE